METFFNLLGVLAMICGVMALLSHAGGMAVVTGAALTTTSAVFWVGAAILHQLRVKTPLPEPEES